MLGIRSGLSDEDAIEASKLWGSAAVHPSAEGYACIATKLEEELSSDGKFTNAPKFADTSVKRPRLDLSLSRQPWVEKVQLPYRVQTSNPTAEADPVQGDATLEVAAANEVADTNTNGGSGVTRAPKARRTPPSKAEANRTEI
jgi:hypothetical protein